MPNIKSAMKRVKINEKKNLRNRMVKSQTKTSIRKFEQAIADQKLDEAKELLIAASSRLDKAASKGVIHKNTASRKKSRLALRLKKAQA